MEDNFNPASHIETRQELMKMQNAGGAMINPFVLCKVFNAVILKKGVEIDQDSIRSYAYTFCALANEFFIINCKEKFPKCEFFILDDRWEKYFISPDIRERSIEFLQNLALIVCDSKELPPDKKVVRTFKISLEQLSNIRRVAEEIYEEERAKRKPF